MSIPARYGVSALALALARSATRPAASPATLSRAFSISLRLRDDRRDDKPARRTNPLIGNLPSRPAAQRNPDGVAPPPPPPAARSQDAAAAAASSTSGPEDADASTSSSPSPLGARKPALQQRRDGDKPHAYNAARPLSIDLSTVIANASASHAATNPSVNPTALPNVFPNAKTGRTIFLPTYSSGPAMALGRLGALVARNKIRNKSITQKYHERPGIRKKRLHGSRWKRRFAGGFRAACDRVTELKRQGW